MINHILSKLNLPDESIDKILETLEGSQREIQIKTKEYYDKYDSLKYLKHTKFIKASDRIISDMFIAIENNNIEEQTKYFSIIAMILDKEEKVKMIKLADRYNLGLIQFYQDYLKKGLNYSKILYFMFVWEDNSNTSYYFDDRYISIPISCEYDAFACFYIFRNYKKKPEYLKNIKLAHSSISSFRCNMSKKLKLTKEYTKNSDNRLNILKKLANYFKINVHIYNENHLLITNIEEYYYDKHNETIMKKMFITGTSDKNMLILLDSHNELNLIFEKKILLDNDIDY